MTMSRGGETGGMTIKDAMREYEHLGYSGQFAPRSEGMIECLTCHDKVPAEKVQRTALRRVEGSSDPDDMVSINALICPSCGAKGTAVFKYGPAATPEEGEAMQRLNAVHTPTPVGDTLLHPTEAERPDIRSSVHEEGFPATPHKAESMRQEQEESD